MPEIKFPLFIFFQDQLILTDQISVAADRFPPGPAQVFDARAQILKIDRKDGTISFSASASAVEILPVDAGAFKRILAQFFRALGDPLAAELEMLPLDQAADQAMLQIENRIRKTTARARRMFWILMTLCGLLPFLLSLWKLPLTASARTIYSGIFLFLMAALFFLQRRLYPK